MYRLWWAGSCALSLIAGLSGCGGDAVAVDRTVATLEPIRGVTKIGSTEALPVGRVAPGEEVQNASAGLSRLRLDGGAALLVGEGCHLTIEDADEIEITSGRAFISIEGGERLRVQTPRGTLGTTDAAFSVELSTDHVAVYVVRGEVGYGQETNNGVVRAGEQLLLGEGGPQLEPAEVWADWTGGLARPGPHDDAGPAGMGTLEARLPGQLGTARRPLLIQKLSVHVEIRGDLAITEIDQVFHNPGAETVEGLYRFRAPEQAVLQRFAIDRSGRLIEAYVRERQQAQASYQAQVYQGSTDDPALLEWDAPGSYHARIYPIGAGQSRRIVVRYAEWLVRPNSSAPRLYTYPMGQSYRPPYIEELSITVDMSDAAAGAIRAGLGATVTGETVELRQNDFRPRADFWIEVGDRAEQTAYRGFRAQHQRPRRAPGSPAPEGEEDERDYLLLPLVIPTDLAEETGRPDGMDLVIVADVSAATDPSHLELGQSTVEALATHLGPEDRIAVVASDLTLRQVIEGEGQGALGPASPERVEALLNGLARVAPGGATDLGAAITAAGDLIDPERRGAVVYVGDGAPTVGELQTADLIERIARLPSTARLYGVAVGAEANLELLQAVTRGRGMSIRVEARLEGAEAALRILAHLGRPMARRVAVHLGSAVENVYPTGEVDVILGDVLPVVGRLERSASLPQTLRVTGTIGGREFERELALEVQNVDDSGDLRLRWAGERLRHLLIEGVPRETIVELGTRYGLITPFTSYYVPSERELRNSGEWSSLPPESGPARALFALASVVAAPLSLSGCRSSDESENAAGAQQPMMEYPAVQRSASSSTASPVVAAEPAPSAEMEESAASDDMGAAGAVQTARSADRTAGMDRAIAPSPAAPEAAPGGHFGIAGQAAQDIPAATAPARPSRGRDLDALLDGALGSGQLRGASGPSQLRAKSVRSRILAKSASRSDDRRMLRQKLLERRRREAAALEETEGEGGAEAELVPLAVSNEEAPQEADLHSSLQCSAASELPLGDRRDLWRERLSEAGGSGGWVQVYQQALQACEAPGWRDRQTLLEQMLNRAVTVEQMVQLYERMQRRGVDAYLRRAILSRVRTPSDLEPVRRAFGGAAEVDWQTLEARLLGVGDAAERVTMLRELVSRNPGSFDLRLRLLSALEEARRLPEALRLAQTLREDSLADAEVRTAVGELLLRQGEEGAARRVFSEMVEFAPYDALARRRLGDLYRAHGWFHDAYRQYQTLAEIRPDDPIVQLLLASAAAGAGRVDEALRLEQRLAESPEPGGSGGLARVAVLSSSARFAKLRKAARESDDQEQLRALVARMRRSAVLRSSNALRVTLIWAHPHAGLSLWSSRPDHGLARPVDVWPELGIEALDLEDLEPGEHRIEVRRSAIDLATAVEAELVIVWNEGEEDEQIQIIPLSFVGDQTILAWTINGRTLAEATPRAAAEGEVL